MTLLVDTPAVRRRPTGVLLVSGPDRLAHLHTMTTQALEGARPGTVADFLHLEARGVPLAAGRAIVRSGDVVLVTPPEVAAALAETLERMRFLSDVAVADVSGSWAVASLRGPAGSVPGGGARSDPMTAAPHGDGVVVRDRSGGVDLAGERAWVDARVAELDLPEAAADDWEAWRIAAGEPAWGAELGTGHRPQELGLLPTHVHLGKGCYPGQESIAKISNLGHVRRALCVLEASGPLAVGGVVVASGRTGVVTSAAPAGEGWIALGFVPLDAEGGLPADGSVTVDGSPARVRRRVGAGIPQPGGEALPVGARR